MKTNILTYLATLLALCVLDVFYLGGFAKNFFESQLGHGVLSTDPVLSAAAMFYLMYAVGVVYFIALPNGARGTFLRAAAMGAGFGFVAYGTYDLTNMATINGWTWQIVMIDMGWGTIATAISSVVGSFTASKLMH
jgi:uncharacterized membrane protein